jgi:hypothetical protein
LLLMVLLMIPILTGVRLNLSVVLICNFLFGWEHQPFLELDIFLRMSLANYLPRLVLNLLLISASWVARITGMSHQCPAQLYSCIITG